jgi:hypothetical protein
MTRKKRVIKITLIIKIQERNNFIYVKNIILINRFTI